MKRNLLSLRRSKNWTGWDFDCKRLFGSRQKDRKSVRRVIKHSQNNVIRKMTADVIETDGGMSNET